MADGESARYPWIVERFERIDPKVQVIVTYAGDRPHHIFERCETGFFVIYFADRPENGS